MVCRIIKAVLNYTLRDGCNDCQLPTVSLTVTELSLAAIDYGRDFRVGFTTHLISKTVDPVVIMISHHKYTNEDSVSCRGMAYRRFFSFETITLSCEHCLSHRSVKGPKGVSLGWI